MADKQTVINLYDEKYDVEVVKQPNDCEINITDIKPMTTGDWREMNNRIESALEAIRNVI